MTASFATSPNQSGPSALKTILLAGLIAGTLDMLAAITVYSLVMNRITVIRLLQGIARGAFGDSAFDGGYSMAMAGLGFHFIIAYAFAIFYFLIFPYISFLKKQRIISGLFYGIFVWCVMNLGVLPLLHIASIPTKWVSIIRGAVILMFFMGLPISLIVSRYYIKRDQQ